ncbi:hypothetical protein UF75_0402 [Desulfosporosinus sp. I2]|nr:hypothetical protein UF75_0402 [Desulfosporosinus sp. I2]
MNLKHCLHFLLTEKSKFTNNLLLSKIYAKIYKTPEGLILQGFHYTKAVL